MTRVVEIYWSHQSPCCHFALDCLLALNQRPEVAPILKPVLPGVIRSSAEGLSVAGKTRAAGSRQSIHRSAFASGADSEEGGVFR